MEPKQYKPSRRERVVPTMAVAAVALTAVAASVMVKKTEDAAPAQLAAAPAAVSTEVITAPPLAAPDTRSMGSAAACKTCGVVQTVVAVNEPGGGKPRAFQMHIRMDDGSTRTIEQRGALAAGSRVQVDGSTVRPLS
jgi:hypothetical protein